MSIKWITPQTIVLGVVNWADVDVSAYVSASCTGVFLHIYNCAGNIGVRKKGSTDTYVAGNNNSHIWMSTGVDANKIFQAITPGGGASLDLVGYTEDETVWFDNAISKTLASTGTYLDIDISGDSGANTAIAIFGQGSTINAYTWGVRKNGSTDDHYSARQGSHFFIGVDASEIFEAKVSNVGCPILIKGYVKSGANVVTLTNATDLSLGSTGAYTDLSALPSTASGGFIEIISSGILDVALRKNGSSEDIYVHNGHNTALIECDTNRLVEGEIESTSIDFFLTGYTTNPASPISGYKGLKGVGW